MVSARIERSLGISANAGLELAKALTVSDDWSDFDSESNFSRIFARPKQSRNYAKSLRARTRKTPKMPLKRYPLRSSNRRQRYPRFTSNRGMR